MPEVVGDKIVDLRLQGELGERFDVRIRQRQAYRRPMV